MRVRITPTQVTGEVSAPPSKSYTHRAVILASLAAGESTIQSPLISDDNLYTIDACRSLGADIALDGDRLKITGTGGQIRVAPDRQWIFAGKYYSDKRCRHRTSSIAEEKRKMACFAKYASRNQPGKNCGNGCC